MALFQDATSTVSANTLFENKVTFSRSGWIYILVNCNSSHTYKLCQHTFISTGFYRHNAFSHLNKEQNKVADIYFLKCVFATVAEVGNCCFLLPFFP